jgi:chromosome partitioning protein
MTLTIAVLNQKGGTGKTTLATNLAAASHLEKRRTLLIDVDSQGSALEWSAARIDGSALEGLPVVKADRALPLKRFREMTRDAAVAILDGPARLGEITGAAAVAADVVLVPLRAGPYDLWAASETIALLDAADALRASIDRRPLRRVFVVNGAVARTQLASEAWIALEHHELAPTIHERQEFPRAAKAGESVLTTATHSAAAHEIRRLWRALRKEEAA